MTRDLVLSMPREPSRGDAGGRAAEGDTSTADAPVADEPVTADAPPEELPARRPVVWVALAALVALASVVVAVVLISGRESEAGGDATAAQPGPPAPALVAPFRIPGVSYAVDEQYPGELLRVMSVESVDPAEVRNAYRDSLARFSAFLRERGHPGPIARQPISIQLVTPDLMCRKEIYRDPARAADCEHLDGWYRLQEKTLLLSLDDQPLSAMAVNVARAVCVEQNIPLCDANLLDDFAERVAPTDGAGGDE
jgi:hypothetical protein